MYLQMNANGTTSVVNRTTFDNFPEFQRIHNNDGTFSLISMSDQFVTQENCTNFKLFEFEEGLTATCNQSVLEKVQFRTKEARLDEERVKKFDQVYASGT